MRLLLQYDAYPDALSYPTATDSSSARERDKILPSSGYQRVLHMAAFDPVLVRNVAIIKWLLLAGASILREYIVATDMDPPPSTLQVRHPSYRRTKIVLEAARYEDVEMFQLILAFAGGLGLADINKLKARAQALRALTPRRKT